GCEGCRAASSFRTFTRRVSRATSRQYTVEGADAPRCADVCIRDRQDGAGDDQREEPAAGAAGGTLGQGSTGSEGEASADSGGDRQGGAQRSRAPRPASEHPAEHHPFRLAAGPVTWRARITKPTAGMAAPAAVTRTRATRRAPRGADRNPDSRPTRRAAASRVAAASATSTTRTIRASNPETHSGGPSPPLLTPLVQ